MQELDWVVGELLAKLDALGIADNTIVILHSIMVPKSSAGPTGARRRSVVKKDLAGKADAGLPMSCAGQGKFLPGKFSTAYSLWKMFYRP